VGNPYAERSPVVVENEQTQTTEVLDATTGARLVIAATNTTVAIDQHGARHFAQQQIKVRGADGRLIKDGEEVYPCTCGCGMDHISQHKICFCEFCQDPFAKGHARTWDDGITRAAVCPRCYEPGRRMRAVKRTLRWLVNI
jgi:hypothetical protein